MLVDFRLRHLVCQRGTAPTSHTCWTTKHLRLATILDSVIARVVTLERLYSKAGVGKLRPSRAICAAREDFLKLCHLQINTTRGLTRRKSDGVLKKMVIAPTLDGKCVRAYNCPQSGIYRLRKGEDFFLFFFFF